MDEWRNLRNLLYRLGLRIKWDDCSWYRVDIQYFLFSFPHKIEKSISDHQSVFTNSKSRTFRSLLDQSTKNTQINRPMRRGRTQIIKSNTSLYCLSSRIPWMVSANASLEKRCVSENLSPISKLPRPCPALCPCLWLPLAREKFEEGI